MPATLTTYSAVTAADYDVARFLANHANRINLYHPPMRAWVAREGVDIVAVLMLNPEPYVSLDLIVTCPEKRPFMRLYRLYQMAEAWLKANRVPIVCVVVHNSQAYFQSIVKRLGYEAIGDYNDEKGNSIETIFAKRLIGETLLAEGTLH